MNKRTPSLRGEVLGVDTTAPPVALVGTTSHSKRTFERMIVSISVYKFLLILRLQHSARYDPQP